MSEKIEAIHIRKGAVYAWRENPNLLLSNKKHLQRIHFIGVLF